eukprot:10561126-Prorocentrum_lima.AAC.1
MSTKCVVSTHPPVSMPYGTSSNRSAPLGSFPKCLSEIVTDLLISRITAKSRLPSSECHVASCGKNIRQLARRSMMILSGANCGCAAMAKY